MKPVTKQDVLMAFVQEHIGLRSGNIAQLLRDYAQEDVPTHVREGLLAVATYVQRTSEAAIDLVSETSDMRVGVRSFIRDALFQQLRAASRTEKRQAGGVSDLSG